MSAASKIRKKFADVDLTEFSAATISTKFEQLADQYADAQYEADILKATAEEVLEDKTLFFYQNSGARASWERSKAAARRSPEYKSAWRDHLAAKRDALKAKGSMSSATLYSDLVRTQMATDRAKTKII